MLKALTITLSKRDNTFIELHNFHTLPKINIEFCRIKGNYFIPNHIFNSKWSISTNVLKINIYSQKLCNENMSSKPKTIVILSISIKDALFNWWIVK